MNRRDLLQLLGIGAASLVVPPVAVGTPASRSPGPAAVPFPPVRVPLPVPADGLSGPLQRQTYRQVSLEDRLVVPEGFTAEVLAAWGDPLGPGKFGFNNDHLSFLSLGGERALLTVNFEYVSAVPWRAGYREVIGADLPFEVLLAALADRQGRVDVSTLGEGDPLRELCRRVAAAALEELGIGVMEIRRDGQGRWSRSPGGYDRRIHGLSGLSDPQERLRVSGPAAAVFRRPDRLGYDDGLGDRVVGTFANCAGGETPWGTVLSAEENMQSQVVEAVFADGSSLPPGERPFLYDGQRLDGLGNPFGLVGNKYGWMVEVDPRRPGSPAVKHSWLGRFRHEAVAVRAAGGEPLVVYSGCDRLGGHLYRFVSEGRIREPADPANSRLFEAGRLEVARFESDGSGRWIPLLPETPLAPLRPSHFARFELTQPTLVPHGDRSRAGAQALVSDGEVEDYLSRHRTLADLYPGSGDLRMGAILIDAHLAANAVGGTPTARPEDTVIDPVSGDLLVAFTAAGGNEDGRSDPAIFRGPQGQPSWPHGWIVRLSDGGSTPGGPFSWRIAATGGPPWRGGLGFSNPDNLAVDRQGNLWMVTDRSTKASDLDLFGNNSCWVLPGRGPAAGEAFCFATGPMECELTGPCFDGPERTLFLSVQHPGEDNGPHRQGDREAQAHRLVDRDGREFEQLRWVPLGSNWPSGRAGQAPRPAVVAIRRLAGGPLLAPGTALGAGPQGRAAGGGRSA